MLTNWSKWASAQWELESGNSFPLLHSHFSGSATSWAVVSDANELAEDVEKGIIYSPSPATEDITSSMTDTFFLQRERSEIWHPNEWPAVEVHARCSCSETISRYVSVLSEGRWLMRPKSWPLGPSWAQTQLLCPPVLKSLIQPALRSSLRPSKMDWLRKWEGFFCCCCCFSFCVFKKIFLWSSLSVWFR